MALAGDVQMRWSPFAAILLAAVLASPLAVPAPVAAQGAAPQAEVPRSPRAPRTKREPTAGQMAARERMRKCAGEWREAKAKGETGGLKWPQYWSKCNGRLKGNSA